MDLDQTCVHILGCFHPVQLSETIWTVDHQVPLFMGFSRQEYWSGLPCPPAGDLPNPGIKPMSFVSPACDVGDPGLIPGSEASLGEGNGYALQYSCLENPVDRGAWRTTVHAPY